MAQIKSYIEAPRFAEFGNALRKFCFKNDFKLDIQTEKGWFRETINEKEYSFADGFKRFCNKIGVDFLR